MNRKVGQAGTLLGIPDKLKAALIADGWILRMDVIWAKPNKSILFNCNRPALDHEHVLILVKAMGHHWDESVSEAQSSIWTIPVNRQANGHCATFPMELARRCIKAGCPKGGVVLDPFAGSGTTGRAASELGREFRGIELKPEYARQANEMLLNRNAA
jgi:DNA modification methylase